MVALKVSTSAHNRTRIMIEQVAKAIDEVYDHVEYNITEMAEAAIKAMREPTDEMCHAFNDAFPTPEGETLLRDIAPIVFKAMIDAALANKRPKGSDNATD